MSFTDLANLLKSNHLNNNLFNSVVSLLGRSKFNFSPPPNYVLFLVSDSTKMGKTQQLIQDLIDLVIQDPKKFGSENIYGSKKCLV